MSVIAFIESNTTGTGQILAENARARGYRPVFFVRNPDKYSFINNFDFVKVDTTKYAELVTAVSSFAQADQISAIMSSSEYFVSITSKIAANLGFPSLDYGVIDLCRDKLRFRKTINGRIGYSLPFEVVKCRDELSSAASRIGYPLVVKPRSGSGSSGVKLCHTIDDLACAYEENEKLVSNGGGEFSSIGCLIEGYAQGQEYSIEVFNGNIIGITKKHLSTPPYFVELGHDFNIDIPTEIVANIKETVLELINLLNINWGPIHIELKADESGVYIIEVNPRLAGGMIPVLVKNAIGVDLLDAWLTASLGNQIDLTPTRSLSSHIRFLIPTAPMEIQRSFDMTNIQELCNSIPSNVNVDEISIYHDAGVIIEPKNDFRDRIGHVIVTSNKCEAQFTAKLASTILSRITHD